MADNEITPAPAPTAPAAGASASADNAAGSSSGSSSSNVPRQKVSFAMHPVHTVKKKVASATTKKQVAAGINSEYVEHKARLASVEETIRTYMKCVEAADNAWSGLFKTHRAFSAKIEDAAPPETSLQACAAFYSTAAHGLPHIPSPNADAVFAILHRKVDAYLAELTAVKKKYVSVERTFSEFHRYSVKAERLNSSKNRNETKAGRNVEKRERSKAEHDALIDPLLIQMKDLWSRHPVVLRIAISAYWLRNAHAHSALGEACVRMTADAHEMSPNLIHIDPARPETFANFALAVPPALPASHAPLDERIDSSPVSAPPPPTPPAVTPPAQHFAPIRPTPTATTPVQQFRPIQPAPVTAVPPPPPPPPPPVLSHASASSNIPVPPPPPPPLAHNPEVSMSMPTLPIPPLPTLPTPPPVIPTPPALVPPRPPVVGAPPPPPPPPPMPTSSGWYPPGSGRSRVAV